MLHRQDKSQNDSTQTEPWKAGFEAIQLLFPCPKLAHDVRPGILSFPENLLGVVGRPQQITGHLANPGEGIADPAIDGRANNLAVVFRVGLLLSREGGQSGLP